MYGFVSLIVVLLGYFSANAQEKETARDTVTISIVHSNDMYGQLLPIAQEGKDYGGMARRVHLILSLKKQQPILVLDAGNALGPDALSAWDRGQTMIETMRLAGYMAVVPGNLDFDYGLEELAKRQEESGIPFLAANVRGRKREAPLKGYRLFFCDGVKIGVVGLVSNKLNAKMNPNVAELLVFDDPVQAFKQSITTLKTMGADYIVGITHMAVDEVMGLAQKVEGVDLFIAGGYQGLERTAIVPAVTQLVNGIYVVTTPRGGSHLGQLQVTFVHTPHGYRPVDTHARTHLIDETIASDDMAANRLRLLTEAYHKTTGEALGKIAGKTRDEQALVIANLMRWHTKTEVGIVHRGMFRGVAPSDSLFVRDVEHFVRFDDVLVKMQLSGAQLKDLVKRSKGAGKGDAGLIFAGMDANELQVYGRDIQNSEPYQVVTLAYLSEGGEGYQEFRKAEQVQHTGISLRSLFINGLDAWGTLSSAAFAQLDHRRIWRSGWHIEGAFRRNYFDPTAKAYLNNKESVSFLRGETNIAWNTATRYYLRYMSGPHVFLFENNNDFGQVGTSFDHLETSSDRLNLSVTYWHRIQEWRIEPFVSSGLNTAFTSNNGNRPFQWRNSLGFQRKFGRLAVQFAGRGQRDFAESQSDFGAEITLQYMRPIQQGGQLRSRLNSFFGLTDRKVIAIENDNQLNFPLAGSLSLNVRQSNFIYRVDKIQGTPVSGVAFRTDLTVGLAYGLNWKWF